MSLDKIHFQKCIRVTADRTEQATDICLGLQNEDHQWRAEVEVIEREFDQIFLGSSLLTAASIICFGSCTLAQRQYLNTLWSHVLNKHGLTFNDEDSPSNRLAQIVDDPLDISRWHLAGLPRNEYVTNPATMIH